MYKASFLKPSKCVTHVSDYCGCLLYLVSSRDSRRLGVVSMLQSYKTCREDGHERNGKIHKGDSFFWGGMEKMIYP